MMLQHETDSMQAEVDHLPLPHRYHLPLPCLACRDAAIARTTCVNRLPTDTADQAAWLWRFTVDLSPIIQRSE